MGRVCETQKLFGRMCSLHCAALLFAGCLNVQTGFSDFLGCHTVYNLAELLLSTQSLYPRTLVIRRPAQFEHDLPYLSQHALAVIWCRCPWVNVPETKRQALEQLWLGSPTPQHAPNVLLQSVALHEFLILPKPFGVLLRPQVAPTLLGNTLQVLGRQWAKTRAGKGGHRRGCTRPVLAGAVRGWEGRHARGQSGGRTRTGP